MIGVHDENPEEFLAIAFSIITAYWRSTISLLQQTSCEGRPVVNLNCAE